MGRVAVDHTRHDRTDSVLLHELQERQNVVDGLAHRCRGRLLRGQRRTRRRRLGDGHRLHRLRAHLHLGCRFLLATLFRVANGAPALVAAHRGAVDEHPPDVRNGLAADQSALVEQPRVLTVELLVAVVRQDGRADLLSDAENESVSPTDGARRRGDQLVVFDRLVERLGFLGVDSVSEGGVHDDRDDVLGMIGHEGHHGFVQLLQAGLRTTLGGDVRAVDDDMSGHPASQPPMGTGTGDSPTIGL